MALLWQNIRSLPFPSHRSRSLFFVLRACSQRRGNDPNDEGPIRYGLSKAAKWKAVNTRQGMRSEELEAVPWYQSLVISLSVGVFLLYFCVFREESDIDHELSKTLYDRIEGLEEKQLNIALKYNQEHGLDHTDIEARLRELAEEKKTRIVT